MSTDRSTLETKSSPATSRPAEKKALKDLRFDIHNPRFGPGAGEVKDEAKILDRIVDVHGVVDLLSSLAVNGYSDAEPLIGLKQKDGSIVIKEGNRRLAACLILADDPRAKNQETKKNRYRAINAANGGSPVDPVPVILYEQDELQLILPYLGVKHIVGAEPWSAWAKAAWADDLVSVHGIPIEQAMEMVGDEQGLLPRILSSYYFIKQLIEARRFDPKDSQKKGAGGAEFPFSLVYNALGYGNIKTWVGFEGESDPKQKPIPKDKLDAATDLVDLIFGNKSKDMQPAVRDSRQLKALNRIAGDRESVVALKRGESIDKVARRLEPVNDQLQDGLSQVKSMLEEMTALVAGKEIAKEERDPLLPPAESVARLARNLYTQLYTTPQIKFDLFPEMEDPASAPPPVKRAPRKSSR